MAVARSRSLEAPVEMSPRQLLLCHTAAQQGDDVLEQLVPRAEGAILLGQGDGHTASLTTGDDGDLMHWVVGGQGVHGDGVTGFVVSGELSGMGG